jgi:multiple sugar transport system permease protein
MTTAKFTSAAAVLFGPPKIRAAALPWAYLAPALAVTLVWIHLPLVQAAWLSFHEWNMLPSRQPRWVGWDNYANLLTLPDMRRAVTNTGLYVLSLLPLSVVIPLAVAILTQGMTGRARGLYRALIFVPMIVAPVVAAILWRWLLNDTHGLVNATLSALGIGRVGFLQDPSIALWTLVWITGWKLIGFSTLLLSAANAAISPVYIEAARMDGATPWQIVRDIRLPLLSSTLLLLTMMTVLFGAQWSFVYVNVLTGGGPLKSTTNVFFLMWDYGFKSSTAGWSSAAGILTFAALSLIALAMLRLMRRLARYDE